MSHKCHTTAIITSLHRYVCTLSKYKARSAGQTHATFTRPNVFFGTCRFSLVTHNLIKRLFAHHIIMMKATNVCFILGHFIHRYKLSTLPALLHYEHPAAAAVESASVYTLWCFNNIYSLSQCLYWHYPKVESPLEQHIRIAVLITNQSPHNNNIKHSTIM